MKTGSGIRSWPAENRPRERLLALGENALSDVELLAILLRTGVRGSSALTLAQRLLEQFGSPPSMAAATSERWSEIPGLGPAKIAQVRAALEVGRRLTKESPKRGKNLASPDAAAEYLRQRLRGLGREQFVVLFLNRRGRLIEERTVAVGTVHGVTPSSREMPSLTCLHCGGRMEYEDDKKSPREAR